MMNPWLILGIGIAWVVSVSVAYVKGKDAMEDQLRAEYATALEKTIKQHNDNALIDMQAALDAGQREAKVRTKVVTLTNEVERVTREKPAPVECRVTEPVFNLMRVAVEIANGTDKDAASPVPTGTGKIATAGKP